LAQSEACWYCLFGVDNEEVVKDSKGTKLILGSSFISCEILQDGIWCSLL
jgi:hypothetical protein